LKDNIVVITGATSGIGEATAHAFAKINCKLVLAGRNTEKLAEVKEVCLNYGAHQCITVTCDVSKEEDCRELIHQTIQHFGTLDVLINNAGISMRALFAIANWMC
jgi:dehydrogenase/reductase SDR family protein 7B